MKFQLTIIFALMAVSLVNAIDAASITTCITNLPGCGSDATCVAAAATWATCQTTNGCAAKISTRSDYVDCLQVTCKSSTSDKFNTYIEDYLACSSGFYLLPISLIAFIGLFIVF